MNATINEKQSAEVLGVAVQTLRNWRHLRKGPAYYKIERAVRYRLSDLNEYLEKKKIDPESDN